MAFSAEAIVAARISWARGAEPAQPIMRRLAHSERHVSVQTATSARSGCDKTTLAQGQAFTKPWHLSQNGYGVVFVVVFVFVFVRLCVSLCQKREEREEREEREREARERVERGGSLR